MIDSKGYTPEETAAIDIVAELVDQQLMPELRREQAVWWRDLIPWRSKLVRELSSTQTVMFRMWSQAHARQLAETHARAMQLRAERADRLGGSYR